MFLELSISFIIYLTTILAIGIISARKSKTDAGAHEEASFIVGGRSTHWFLTALSAHASDMSDWLFMGLPAAVYLQGGSQAWIAIGLVFGMFLCWQYIAAPLRRSSEEYKAVTLASYFKNRFHDTSGLISFATALISFFFFTYYLSVGLKGIGYVLKAAFGLNYHLGLFLAVLVVVLYTVVGGFVSVAWIDLFQGLFLLAMLLLVPVVAFFSLKSASIIPAAQAQGISLSLLPDYSLKTILGILLNPFAWCLGYFGMPHILSKFMGAQDARSMHKAKYVGIAWQVLALSAAVAVGIIGIAFFQNGVPGRPEFIFIEMTKSLFSPWWTGWILCAILAATISTVDSQLLVLAGIVAQDFYKDLLFKKATLQQTYAVYRIALVVAALLGLVIAWDEQSTIMDLVKFAWSGLGSSFGPLMILSLYSSRVNKYGAFWGILAGGIMSASWNYLNPLISNMPIYSILPGFLAGFVTIVVVSYVTEK